MEPSYRYRARATRVIDGDTFLARVDLGFATERGGVGIENPIRVRVRDLWCPELHEKGGEEATAEARMLLITQPLVIETFKDERSMERWIADVWLVESDVSLAFAVISSGWGYATKKELEAWLNQWK